MRIAMIGTRGVPARYGGFESAVEEIGTQLVERGHEVIVYCRNEGQTITEYRGMRLVNLPAVRLRSTETLSHSGLSAARAIVRDRPDVAFVFNPANAPYLRLLRVGGVPCAVNLDGMEWMRPKWAGAGARYFKWAERASVRAANVIIADSQVMQARVLSEFGRTAEFIPYGAVVASPGSERLGALGVQPHRYHLVVARFEPENQVLEIVEGFAASTAELPLLVVGSAPYGAEYSAAIARAAGADPRIRFVGSVWDATLLEQLYAGAATYLHGHSVGGTNPSLLRAMAVGAPVIAHDNPFNAEVLGGCGVLVADARNAAVAAENDERNPDAARERGAAGQARIAAHYRWSDVVDGYESVANRLTNGRGAGGLRQSTPQQHDPQRFQ